MEVTINIPEDVASILVGEGKNLEREILEAAAIEGYRAGKLSHAQVGRMLGLSRFEVDAVLKAHDVPLNYTLEDLEADRRTLGRLLSK